MGGKFLKELRRTEKAESYAAKNLLGNREKAKPALMGKQENVRLGPTSRSNQGLARGGRIQKIGNFCKRRKRGREHLAKSEDIESVRL